MLRISSHACIVDKWRDGCRSLEAIQIASGMNRRTMATLLTFGPHYSRAKTHRKQIVDRSILTRVCLPLQQLPSSEIVQSHIEFHSIRF